MDNSDCKSMLLKSQRMQDSSRFSYSNLSFNGLLDHLDRNEVGYEIEEESKLKSVYYKIDNCSYCSGFLNTGVQVRFWKKELHSYREYRNTINQLGAIKSRFEMTDLEKFKQYLDDIGVKHKDFEWHDSFNEDGSAKD